MRGTGGAWAAIGTALHTYLADSTDAGCRKVDLPPLSAGMSMPLQLQAHDKVRLGGCAPRAVDAARVAYRPAPRFRLRTASSPKEFVCMDSEGDPDYEAHHLMTSLYANHPARPVRPGRGGVGRVTTPHTPSLLVAGTRSSSVTTARLRNYHSVTTPRVCSITTAPS